MSRGANYTIPPVPCFTTLSLWYTRRLQGFNSARTSYKTERKSVHMKDQQGGSLVNTSVRGQTCRKCSCWGDQGRRQKIPIMSPIDILTFVDTSNLRLVTSCCLSLQVMQTAARRAEELECTQNIAWARHATPGQDIQSFSVKFVITPNSRLQVELRPLPSWATAFNSQLPGWMCGQLSQPTLMDQRPPDSRFKTRHGLITVE